MAYLDSRAKYIELSNEPNALPIPENPDGTHIPSLYYGKMAAAATFWLYNCFPHPNHRYLVAGSLMPGGYGSSYDGGWIYYAKNVESIMNQEFQRFYPLDGPNWPDHINLVNSWQLSLHPYPARGASEVVGGVTIYPTDPANSQGDKTGNAGATTVINQIASIHNAFSGIYKPNRKLWITETGMSSRKVGEIEQMRLFFGLMSNLESDASIEGVTAWPLSDSDPRQQDLEGQFTKMAVTREDLNQAKPAGSVLSSIYSSW